MSPPSTFLLGGSTVGKTSALQALENNLLRLRFCLVSEHWQSRDLLGASAQLLLDLAHNRVVLRAELPENNVFSVFTVSSSVDLSLHVARDL